MATRGRKKIAERYEGELATPIRLHHEEWPVLPLSDPTVATPQERLAELQQQRERFRSLTLARSKPFIQQERDRKLILLAERFGMDPEHPDTWKAIAMELAIAHVPGFSVDLAEVRTVVGRPMVWSPHLYMNLYTSVMHLSRFYGMGEKDACQKLALDLDWARLVSRRSIYRRFREAKSNGERLGWIGMANSSIESEAADTSHPRGYSLKPW